MPHRRLPLIVAALTVLLAVQSPMLPGQSDASTKPIVGLRENRPNKFALVGGHVVLDSTRKLENATVLISGEKITSVGADIVVPEGFRSIDCVGKTIYPAWIDAFTELDVPAPEPNSAAHWNQNVVPQRSAAGVAVSNTSSDEKRRAQGFAIRVVAPQGAIVKGSSAAIALCEDPSRRLLNESVWQHLQITVPRKRTGSRYPNSPMGATALLRQSMYDAKWYRLANKAHVANPQVPRPEQNIALQSLGDAMDSAVFVIDAQNERMALRAEAIAKEFSLKVILRGSGREYRDLAAIAKTGRAILVPIDFPDRPDVNDPAQAQDVSLQDLLHWDLAPENPNRLSQAGVKICLTTDGLDDVGKFLKKVRIAVSRGLPEKSALEALTTTPAELIGIDHLVGRIDAGYLANLIVSDGDIFAKDTKILETWVAGDQHAIAANQLPTTDALAGQWTCEVAASGSTVSALLTIKQDKSKLSGQLEPLSNEADAIDDETNSTKEDEPSSNTSDDSELAEQKKPKAKQIAKLKDLVREHDRLLALVDLSELSPKLTSGVTRVRLVNVDGQASTITALFTLPDGTTQRVELSKSTMDGQTADKARENGNESEEKKKTESPTDGQEPEPDPDPESDPESTSEPIGEPLVTPTLYPLGAYGLVEPITETPPVLFRGATVWTCDEQGVLENADVLIFDGRIQAVGTNLDLPKVCHVFDATGKHITPGLIDCHSHMATDGGVNESGQSVTAEVRIGDFIDNSDINIYRQLAGGLTIANILHGSANPIGGQNQVIKLRWGQSMKALKMKEAPAGVKFALGENVKRNRSRYPNSRMGVEQMIRDQLLAGREYQAKWKRWESGETSEADGLPPRRDLQLQAMSEIQSGIRWIHCHSYRQDEIVATLEVLEEFGVQIGTLQHILEGYKVADRMKQHGAMGSSFSDWWAYKFEVFDAIPYNGALMHQQGVVVSFNSDDRELARRLNTEAAKAVKYGGVSPTEALKFVTLNPAKQLRIDQHVGSLTAGKHADLVVWSGPPLSTLTRCEQTWIDGRRYFDRSDDQKMRARDRDLRAKLIQKALKDDNQSPKASKPRVAKPDEEDRWQRHDVFCGAHGASGHLHTRWERNQ